MQINKPNYSVDSASASQAADSGLESRLRMTLLGEIDILENIAMSCLVTSKEGKI